MSNAALMEDYAKVLVADLRRAVGGRRKLKAVSSVTISVGENDFAVSLVRGPANLGIDGRITFMICPSCGRRISVLRVVPEGLACWSCLRKAGTKYQSQLAAG
jgi:hypothetical protein